MATRGHDRKLFAQKFGDGFDLCGRFYNEEFFHNLWLEYRKSAAHTETIL